MIQIFFKAIFWCLAAIIGAQSVFALDPTKAATQYVHDVWSSNDGLPQDSVNAIAQTADGYLWIATQEGLARFDGSKFTVFDQGNTDGIGNFVFALHADKAGALFVGSGDGLLKHHIGKWVKYTAANGLFGATVKHISEDANNNLWLGAGSGDRSVGGHGLARFKGERADLLTVADGLTNNQVHQTLTDQRGALWIATGNGLNRLENNKFEHFTTADGLAGNLVRAVYQDLEGNIWVGTKTGLSVFKNGEFTSYTTADGLSDNGILEICADRNGTLWIGTEKGLNRIANRKIEAVKEIDGLADDQIQAILEDREGSLWIGTRVSGLHRLRDARFTVWGAAEGLHGNSVRSIFEDRKGNVWIGTDPGGISVLTNGKIRNLQPEDKKASGGVRAMFEDQTGNFWFGERAGINRLDANQSFEQMSRSIGARRVFARKNALAFYEDADGALFVGTSLGLSIFENNKFTDFTRADGLVGDATNFVFRTRSGELLVGGDEGLSRYENRAFKPLTRQTAGDFNPQSVHEDQDGTLWIVTWGQGLHRIKNGETFVYTQKDGLFDNTAWSILDDAAGNLWMGSNRGIFSVPKQELDCFADGEIRRVSSRVYGTADGMRNRETNAGSPAALRTRDGKLWFATVAGAVVIDPKNRENNRIPPPIVIEKIVVDEQTIRFDREPIEFPAAKNVEFNYVGLSFVAPEKVSYKYRLEGFDHDWISADNRRAAFYTNLPARDYEFRVIAANSDGVWNETGAAVKFRVLAPFWRTNWFFGLTILSLGGFAFFVFKLRVTRLRRINRRQTAFAHQLIESQERERKRIAAELHDNLGQHLVIIKNWAALALRFADKDAPAREQLQEISATALQAINEVREIVYDLRPAQLETIGLCETIKFMVAAATRSSGINFVFECDSLDGVFSSEAEVTVYRIVQESVNNVLKHSNANGAEVTIRIVEQTVKIRISDDGDGFVSESKFEPQSRSGFGLIGLNERVEMLGGQLEIHSAARKGATISINVPISRDSANDSGKRL